MKKQTIDLQNKRILVTGSPGFIGANLVMRLAREMETGILVSLDNMNDYYDPALKEHRLGQIERVTGGLTVKNVFVKESVTDRKLVEALFEQYHFDLVIHLAAQTGI